jgi:hypothetical protein
MSWVSLLTPAALLGDRAVTDLRLAIHPCVPVNHAVAYADHPVANRRSSPPPGRSASTPVAGPRGSPNLLQEKRPFKPAKSGLFPRPTDLQTGIQAGQFSRLAENLEHSLVVA